MNLQNILKEVSQCCHRCDVGVNTHGGIGRTNCFYLRQRVCSQLVTSIEPLYVSAIQSAHEHKFLHENAIASELAGMFFLDRGFQQKSLSCFVHSIKSYRAWGAQSVARQVKLFIECNFGYNVSPLVSTAGADTSFEYIFASSLVSQKNYQWADIIRYWYGCSI